MIPLRAHFIHLENSFENNSSKMTSSFNFINYICLKSFIKYNPRIKEIYFWIDEKSLKNHFIVKIKEEYSDIIILETVSPPIEIFGNKVTFVQHQADILRIQKLIELGGIYLDTDVLCVKKFDETLFNYDFVIGKVNKNEITNTIIFSSKSNPILLQLLEGYRDFNGYLYCGHQQYKKITDKKEKKKQHIYWIGHSIINLQRILSFYGHTKVKILDKKYFYTPSYFYMDLNKFLYDEDVSYPDAYCHHLWGSVTNSKLKNINKNDIETNVTKQRTKMKKGYFFKKLKEVLE